jgi:hypothetical protein
VHGLFTTFSHFGDKLLGSTVNPTIEGDGILANQLGIELLPIRKVVERYQCACSRNSI